MSMLENNYIGFDMKNRIITLGIYNIDPMFNIPGWQTRQLQIEKPIDKQEVKQKVIDFAKKHDLESIIVFDN